MNRLSTSWGAFTLTRFPEDPRDQLRAWDASDEYLLGHLAEVAALEPAAVDAWLGDPRTAPHGGEPLLAFITRIGNWLDTRPAEDGSIVAVAEPSVVRAALVYALKAPPATYWNVDVRPLSTVTLTGRPGLWHLHLATAPC